MLRMIQHSKKYIFCKYIRKSTSSIGARDARFPEGLHRAVFVASDGETVQPLEVFVVVGLIFDQLFCKTWKSPWSDHIVTVSLLLRQLEVCVPGLHNVVMRGVLLQLTLNSTSQRWHVPVGEGNEKKSDLLAHS